MRGRLFSAPYIKVAFDRFGIGSATRQTQRPCMQKTALPDLFTVIAIAVIAYVGVNISHEIVGHCSMAALVGTKCRLISSTYIPLVKEITEIPTWKYNIILVAGSTANWTIGFVCFGLLLGAIYIVGGLLDYLALRQHL